MSPPKRRRAVVVLDLSEVARAVGARVRARRQAVGLTQRQVAGDRYTPAYISALERGLAKPSVASLFYLAQRLGCRPSDLLDDRPSQISAASGVPGGAPVFAGTRMPIAAFLDAIAAGYGIDAFIHQHPAVSREQVLAVLGELRELVTRRGTTSH